MAVEFPIDGDARQSREALLGELNELRARLAALEFRLQPASRELQEQLRITLESIGDGFFACDKDWRFVYVNRLAENLLGIRREEVLGKSHWEVFPLTRGTRLEEEYRRAAAGEIRIFENFYDPWDRWFHVRCFPREGGGMSVYFQDITDRKQTEEALRKSEERFRKIYENAAMGIAIADARGRYRHCNPAFCSLLGYSEGELQQMDFVNLVYPEDKDANLSEINRLTAGEVSYFEIKNRYVHKNGLPVWVHKFVSVLPGEAGQAGHFMALVSDITPTVKAKAMLDDLSRALLERTNLAEKRAADIQHLAMELSLAEDRERQRLASVLHDDLQQMLAYLKIQLTSPLAHEDVGGKIERLAELVDRCIDHCRNLSHDLNPPILRKKDFAGALQWLCSRMEERHGLKVDCQIAPEQSIHPFVLSSMLFRSIRELLFNVVKHAGVKCAAVAARVDQDRFLVTVQDAGAGCDPAVLQTKQNEEDVFGLFDIEDRVRFLGGEVRIESQPGKGFAVTLSIPLEGLLPSAGMPAMPETDEKPAIETLVQDLTVAQALDGAVIKVAIAEDNDLMRTGLSKLLQDQEGVTVICTAVNGREAVQLASQLLPDVILMDVSMPVMNGIKATAEIRQQHPEINVIGLTIHKDPDIRQAMLDAGACACLSKSGSPEELIRAIRAASLSKRGSLEINP